MGGVSVQFFTLAKAFNEQGVQVRLVDYADGAMSRLNIASDAALPVSHYGAGSAVTVGETSILIIQAMTPWTLWPILKLQTRRRYCSGFVIKQFHALHSWVIKVYQSLKWGRLANKLFTPNLYRRSSSL